jgi:hypothetical protein
MGLNVPKRGRNPYRAAKTSKDTLDPAWRLEPAKYEAALAEAQARADRDGCDVGLFPCDLSKSWSNRALPAPKYRTGDDTTMNDGHRCQIVTPTRPSADGTFGLACAQHRHGVHRF